MTRARDLEPRFNVEKTNGGGLFTARITPPAAIVRSMEKKREPAGEETDVLLLRSSSAPSSPATPGNAKRTLASGAETPERYGGASKDEDRSPLICFTSPTRCMCAECVCFHAEPNKRTPRCIKPRKSSGLSPAIEKLVRIMGLPSLSPTLAPDDRAERAFYERHPADASAVESIESPRRASRDEETRSRGSSDDVRQVSEVHFLLMASSANRRTRETSSRRARRVNTPSDDSAFDEPNSSEFDQERSNGDNYRIPIVRFEDSDIHSESDE